MFQGYKKKVFSAFLMALAASALLWAAVPTAARSGDTGESAIIKRESGEVVLKSSSDCRDSFKSSFVRKLESIVASGSIKSSRLERLKNEIRKTKERIASRLEKIDKNFSSLRNERENLGKIAESLDSVEIRLLKLKVVMDDTCESVVRPAAGKGAAPGKK